NSDGAFDRSSLRLSAASERNSLAPAGDEPATASRTPRPAPRNARISRIFNTTPRVAAPGEGTNLVDPTNAPLGRQEQPNELRRARGKVTRRRRSKRSTSLEGARHQKGDGGHYHRERMAIMRTLGDACSVASRICVISFLEAVAFAGCPASMTVARHPRLVWLPQPLPSFTWRMLDRRIMPLERDDGRIGSRSGSEDQKRSR